MNGLLHGVRVVDITANVAGPFAGTVLVDLGATVWKIENPETGDVVRNWPPFRDGTSTTFASLNRGKRSVAIDLKHPEGRAAFASVLRSADVVLESLRPGSFERLGFGWQRLHELNPRLVYCSLTAFGDAGPMAGEPGFDAIIQAYSGLMNLTGHPGEPPVRIGTGVVDIGTGLWCVIGILGALLHRAGSGRGVRVDTTLLGTALSLQVHHLASVIMAGVVPQRLGTAQHNTAPYEAITARDGQLMVGVTGAALWQRFLSVVDDGSLARDPDFQTNEGRVRNRTRLRAAINALIADRDSAELHAALATAGVPNSRIRDISEIPDDPQVKAMGIMREWEPGVVLPTAPVRIDVGEPDIPSELGVPRLGDSTAEVLREAGVGADEIDRLAAAGVIGVDR